LRLQEIPFWVDALALVVLVLVSAFFSIAETSMMALNRFRLGHMVKLGRPGAAATVRLLGRTERLLGTVLLGNNLVNTAMTALVTSIAISQFGNNDTVLLIATTAIALLIIIFCEITPKVIGASRPEAIALPSSFVLEPLTRFMTPAVWFVNLLSGWLLRLLRVGPDRSGETRLSPEELRTIVLESGHFIPGKHRAILLNLFDLEHITVDDVMTPRNRVEALDLATSEREIREQLLTCYHNKLPVFEGELNRLAGILHVRRALSLLQRESFDRDDLRALLSEPYFIPSGTPVYTQLQFFQEQRQRVGMVVDEYGELLGLVTLEDIIEEIIGEFTTTAPGGRADTGWDEEGGVIVEGISSLRALNRRLGTEFALDGPRTLNGLILEALQDIPDGNVCLRFGPIGAEVLQIQGRVIRSVRLHRLGAQARADVA
jgi:Mg2+/Co2+ transporter CorB